MGSLHLDSRGTRIRFECRVSRTRGRLPLPPRPSPTLRVALAMHPFAWTLLVSLVVLAGHADVAVAPFPPEHAYHWLNPWIEPWWVHLSKGEQEKIYGHWEKVEPLLISLADKVEDKKEFIQGKLGEIAYKRKQRKMAKADKKERRRMLR